MLTLTTTTVSCHFAFISLQPFDTDIEDDWSKSLALHVLIQRENSISLPEREDVQICDKISNRQLIQTNFDVVTIPNFTS
jgi:hypothetical protein